MSSRPTIRDPRSAVHNATGKERELSFGEQLELITESIEFGFLLGCFTSNRGLNNLVSGYNGGIYPYRLGNKAVHKHIEELYRNVVKNRKLEISPLLPPSMMDYQNADDKADIYKYRRIFSIQHD